MSRVLSTPRAFAPAVSGLAAGRVQAMVAFLAAFAFAAVTSYVMPVWSRVDEAQHADFVSRVAQGQWPVEGTTRVQQPIADAMASTGTWRWWLPGMEPAPTSTRVADYPVPASASPEALDAWLQRHLWTFSYEAGQPPLFYLLAAGPWALAASLGGLPAAVHLVRLADALLVGAVAVLARATALRLGLDRRLALAAALATGLLPGLVVDGAAVSNDLLATALGSLLVLITLRWTAMGWTAPRALSAGLLAGLVVEAKVTAAGVGLALVAGLLLQDAGWPARLRQMALAGAGTVAAVLPWVFVNLAVYGAPTPARGVDHVLGPTFAAAPLTALMLAHSVEHAFTTFWTGEPWDLLPINGPLVAAAVAWCVVALGALAWSWRSLTRAHAVAGFAVAGCLLGALAALRLSGLGGDLPGRYLYPSAAAAIPLLILGATLTWRRAGLALAATTVLVAALNLAAFGAGWSAESLPAVRQPGPAAGTAVVARGTAGTATLEADRVLLEPASGRLWVHVTIAAGASALDWWPQPQLVAGRTTLVSAYAEGERFPERLDPGASRTGWIAFESVPSEAVHSPLQVVFRAVSTDGYASIADLGLEVPAGAAGASSARLG